MGDAVVAREDTAATEAVQNAMGHRIRDHGLLRRALTHASRAPAQAARAQALQDSNERLEFLGDAVLGAALAQILYDRHPARDEGHLSLLRARLQSRATLARTLTASPLLAHCRVGAQLAGEPAGWPDSVKANFAEAVLAAVWLDGGWQALRVAVERFLAEPLADPQGAREDPRLRLQSWALEHFQQLPGYACNRLGGSDHNPEFQAEVAVGPHLARGQGGSRRRAEAAAAEALLTQLGMGPAAQ